MINKTLDFNSVQDQFFDLHLTQYTNSFPCLLSTAQQPSDSVAIYIHGLNGTKSTLSFLVRKAKNIHLIGFDARGCGENKIPATKKYEQYATDLYNFIVQLKKDLAIYHIKHFYLIGESFGSAISFLFFRQHQDLVDGLVCWSMPKKVIDVSQQTTKQKLKQAGPLLYSFLTNKPTYDYPPCVVDQLSNNRTLILATKLRKIKADNRSTLAAWRGNLAAWKVVLSKAFLTQLNKKVIYLSVYSDPLIDLKATKKLDEKLQTYHVKNLIHLNLKKGTHILLFDKDYYELVLSSIEQLVSYNQNEIDFKQLEQNLLTIKNNIEK